MSQEEITIVALPSEIMHKYYALGIRDDAHFMGTVSGRGPCSCRVAKSRTNMRPIRGDYSDIEFTLKNSIFEPFDGPPNQ